MFRRRLQRLATTAVVLLSLLFAQLALAGYACPTGTGGEQAAMEMAPGQPCEGMDADGDQPALCHQHCADAAQSFDPVKVPTASLPAVVLVLIVPAVLDADEASAASSGLAGASRPPPDPIFLSTLRLRV